MSIYMTKKFSINALMLFCHNTAEDTVCTSCYITDIIYLKFGPILQLMLIRQTHYTIYLNIPDLISLQE